MKKCISVTICLLLFNSIAAASPLMDYSQGKWSADVIWRNTVTTIGTGSRSFTLSKKANPDGTLTLGLNNNLAIQYRYFAPTSADMSSPYTSNATVSSKLATNEVNVLCKLDKNVSALVGTVSAKGYINSNTPGLSQSTKTKNLCQMGIVGSTEIANKTTLWGIAAIGNDVTNYEIGLGYVLTPNLEFNISYREMEVKNMHSASTTANYKEKGLGCGLTYKF